MRKKVYDKMRKNLRDDPDPKRWVQLIALLIVLAVVCLRIAGVI